MKPRLLFADRDVDYPEPSPQTADLERDLGLGPVLDAMGAGDAFVRDVARRVLLSEPLTHRQVAYRQDVLEDCVRRPDALRELYDLATVAAEAKRRARVWIPINRPGAILQSAVVILRDLTGHLRRLHEFVVRHRGEFESPGFTALFDSVLRELDASYLARMQGYVEQLEFSGGVVLTARLGPGCTGVGYVLREPGPTPWWTFLRDLIPVGGAYTYHLPPRDDNGGRTLDRIRDHGINQVANAAAQSADHVLDFFRHLRLEAAFYLGSVNLHQAVREVGAPTCRVVAEPPGPGAFTARGLVDAGLALRIRRAPVGSDLDADGARLVMVTGANEGGKSTLLRAAGLAQLMLDAGLFVTADRARASVSTGVVTHYRREEDAALEHGKFDDELERMSRLVDRARPGTLVLLDESFSSTNEREGSQVARDVVEALVAAGIRVWYVTHLYTLSHGLAERHNPHDVFLRAERDPGGGRSFRLLPGEPESTSYALDQFREVFHEPLKA